MTDCEIVLRFFSFRNPSAIRGSVKTILDNCMEENREADPAQVQAWRTAFLESLNLAHQIFGSRTFQVKDLKGGWKHSQPLFDAVMIAAETYSASKVKLIANRAKLTKDLNDALSDSDTYEIVVGKPNTAQAIRDRLSIVGKLFKKYS